MLLRKAQVGLEYLITYGWALVIVASVIGVLAFVYSPNIEAEHASGFDKILYHAHAVSADGKLYMSLQNKSGRKMLITGIEFSGDFSGSASVSNNSLISGETFTLTGDTGLSAGETYTGIVKIYYDTEEGFSYIEEATVVGKAEGTGTAVSEVTLDPTAAVGYQDSGEGTGCQLEEDHTALVNKLDGQWAVPSTCSGITYNYYATGSSPAFFDALAVKFNVSMYDPAVYDGTIRLYIKHGSYSDSSWHHYKVYDDFKDNSECYDSGPPCGGSKSFAYGYEGWIEESLDDSIWDDGELSVRIWNARVDKVELKLSKVSG